MQLVVALPRLDDTYKANLRSLNVARTGPRLRGSDSKIERDRASRNPMPSGSPLVMLAHFRRSPAPSVGTCV
ncbi:MAG: hypothetical protein ACFB21_14485 [Opitutales bacterium]